MRGSSWRGCGELKFFGNNSESSINSPKRISFTSLGGGSCTESKILLGCRGNAVDIIPTCAINSSNIKGFLDFKMNVALTQRVSLRNNSLRRRTTSEGVHCRLGSCGRCLVDRLVDGCLDLKDLNLGQLALRQHSFVQRVEV